MEKQPNIKAQTKAKPKPKLLLRLLCFLIALFITIGAVTLIVCHDSLNLDSLRRWFTYHSLTLNDSGQAASFRYAGSIDDVFIGVNGDLLVCSPNAISLYAGSGVQYVDLQVSMTNPAAEVSGNIAVVYDVGGSELYLFRQREVIFELKCPGTLLSAHLHSSGLLTVISQESGYRGVITVYDTDGTIKASLRLSSTYIMDAVLSDSGTTLVVATIGQIDGSFSSFLSYYDLTGISTGELSYDVSPTNTVALGSSVALTLKQENGRIWILGDQSLSVADYSGNVLGSVNLFGRNMKSYNLSGSGFVMVQLGRYHSGTQSDVYLIGNSGQLDHTLTVEEQILAISAAGRYFAVLTSDRLDIYTYDMNLYASLSGTHGARKIFVYPDGSAILISADSAQFYVPS